MKAMLTISVENGGVWTQRTLTLKGEEDWIRQRWPEVFPQFLDRAIKGAETETDDEEPDEKEA